MVAALEKNPREMKIPGSEYISYRNDGSFSNTNVFADINLTGISLKIKVVKALESLNSHLISEQLKALDMLDQDKDPDELLHITGIKTLMNALKHVKELIERKEAPTDQITKEFNSAIEKAKANYAHKDQEDKVYLNIIKHLEPSAYLQEPVAEPANKPKGSV